MGHVVFIRGEPGVGKTRLAAELAAEAHDNGAVVLFGRCDEEVPLPFRPFVEALRTWSFEVAPDRLLSGLGDSPAELLRLVPELSELCNLSATRPVRGR